MMEEIPRLWLEFSNQPFPRGYVGKDELDDLSIDLAEVSSFAAGCIDTFIHNKGNLDEWRVSVLKECVRDLTVLKNLFGEDNLEYKSYSIQLLVLSEKVLEASQ